MLDKLKSQIEVERRLLHRLLETYGALLARCCASDPTCDELAALAAILHAFYNGVENIFKRVTLALDSDPLRGEAFWHAELLESMSRPSPNRPALISPEPLRTIAGVSGFSACVPTCLQFRSKLG